jgi:hypothetical protein
LAISLSFAFVVFISCTGRGSQSPFEAVNECQGNGQKEDGDTNEHKYGNLIGNKIGSVMCKGEN